MKAYSYTVYAIDLLGQGIYVSRKPTENVTYSTNLWANQLDDLNKEHVTKYLQMDIYIVLGVDYDHI